jgi:type IV pilus assembly protein PilB
LAKRMPTFSERLCENLLKENLITKKQLTEARMAAGGHSLGMALVRTGAISSEELISFIAAELQIPHVDLRTFVLEPSALDLVPEELAQRYTLIPLFVIDAKLTIAIADPLNVFALDDIRMRSGMDINVVIAARESINLAIDEYYRGLRGIGKEINEASASEFADNPPDATSAAQLHHLTTQPLVVRLVNEIIQHAVVENASDVHIEPERDKVEIRYRIDGILYKGTSIPKKFQMAAVSRLKIMANMDIAERRVPQDGRIQTDIHRKTVDIRVSTMPTTHGEKVVLRILDKDSFGVDLDNLGMSPDNLQKLRVLLPRPYGLILSCGPTGSGKSTTLYALLNEINTPEKNIVTLEDPVEYDIAHISQCQTNRKAGLTFASGLRTILRQDPDVIMLGEIRDFETAELSVRGSLTGHLVLTTMHTVDAPSAAIRLIDIGVAPFLVASSISAIIAQRLVRKICPDCKKPYKPSAEILKKIGLKKKDDDAVCYQGEGCKLCHFTGYRGRTGIFELMAMNEHLREIIISQGTADLLRREVAKSGYQPLRVDGIEKARAGITTIDEVLRETLTEE